MKKRLFITVSICFALGLITASPLLAQNPGTAYPIVGTAGFETGLWALAYIEPPIASVGNDVIVSWGDASPNSAGLLWQSKQDSSGNYWVFGTHLYTQAGTYAVHITYQWTDCPTIFTCQTANADLQATATISAPGKFVILSIGDSIASGEGNPAIPNNDGTNNPAWSFWDDNYSSDLYFGGFPADENNEWPGQAFPCHRSSLAGPAQAAQFLQTANTNSDITFIHYACSGAAIEAGDTASTWTQDAVGQLKIARERLAQSGAGVDILLISAGSNSLYGPTTFGNGFGGLVKYCLQAKPTTCDVNDPMHTELTQSLSSLPTYYKNLAMEINCQQPPPFTGADGKPYQDPDPGCTDPQKQIPKLVLITEYMDPTQTQAANDSFPTSQSQCDIAFSKLDYEPDGGDFRFFKYGVVNPLNDAVVKFPVDAQNAGLRVPTYAVTGIGGSDFPGDGDDFSAHGACSDSNRWVNIGNDSIYLLGEGPPPTGTYPGQHDTNPITALTDYGDSEMLNGMLHPNSSFDVQHLGNAFFPQPTCGGNCGQEDYKNRIVASTIQFNPPVTMASATAAFGTWTNQTVVVTLTATNDISQADGSANVGPTYYAVDSTQCGSSFATQYPANVPGCKVYAGPFTISDSGKHTVTFFSANASGYPVVAPAPFLNPPNYPLVPPLEGVLQSVQVLVDKNPPLSSVPDTMTIPEGESASYTIMLGHFGWTGQTIQLSCSDDAALTQCTMLPTSVTLDATNSNTSVATVVTTLGTFPTLGHGTLPPATGTRPSPFHPLLALRLLLALITAAFLFGMGRRMHARRWASLMQFAAIGLFFGLLCAGCNSAAQPPSTPKGAYTVTITGTDGTTTNTVKTTLIVK